MWRTVHTVVFLLLASSTAFAHGGDADFGPAQILRSWEWDPAIVVPLALMMALYVAGLFRMRSRPRRTRIVCFFLGWSTLTVALISPLHAMGTALFSAHMAQHELLMIIAAPMLVLAHPSVVWLFALPPHARGAVAGFAHRPAIQNSWVLLSAPLVAWTLHAVALWVWHAPALYQATLTSDAVHALQHLSFLFSALLFWWALLNVRQGRSGEGAALAYIFTTAIHSSVLGALLTFSSRPWYPVYEGRTLAWGLTALQDQQLGGLIMWVPAGLVYIFLALWLAARWLAESDRRVSFTKVEEMAREGRRHA